MYTKAEEFKKSFKSMYKTIKVNLFLFSFTGNTIQHLRWGFFAKKVTAKIC